ncbi:sn-glycerol-3-phosphate transport system permease protein UgpE [Paenibacillus glycanilyticus]|uniref:Sn-glycerol-3-phosphate transport system permease protein UgpE n=1 Tax=Paenibacillus glycanilyticus TaxID=126569 RepID=A0ABQ6NLK4_9BACL|nr:carbohydrate ABC transporter permease [Paenibacillus glycanilyticus]GMK45971.1 sn-glycerol-3-phosphate transport system permease protein UgpE [Paenibacillus glycanilyticus]
MNPNTKQVRSPVDRRFNRSYANGAWLLLRYLLLFAGVAVTLFPFLWMAASSFKEPKDLFDLSLIPSPATWSNFGDLFVKAPFGLWFANTAGVAVVSTVSVLVFDTMVGYVLAKFVFPGRSVIFVFIISTLMVPTEMLIIPWYLLASKLGLSDTYAGLLLPGLISAFGIFLMRQFMESLPSELLDAARIDGLNEWRVFSTIALPLMKPALATLAILSFISGWNQFIWPFIVLQTENKYTLPVGMVYFSSELKDNSGWILIMTAATVSVLPLITIFLIFQKRIIQGIALSGMK